MFQEISSRISAEYGFGTGALLSIMLNWQHIVEKGIETAIITFIGGAAGALGGLFIAWLIKKIKR